MGVYIKGRFNYDPDALAFIQASSIPNTTQKLAINQLVLDLKAYGLWNKMKAIYPMVGGSAFYHKWNLKDPRDLDAAFRLNFVGGWTHSAAGALPNGTNGYADTFLIPNIAYTVATNAHFSFYSRTNINQNAIEIGTYDNTQAFQISLFNGSFSNNTRSVINNAINLGSVDTNSLGFYVANRNGTTVKNFKNSSIIATGTNTVIAKTTTKIWIGAQNFNNGLNLPSSKQCAFASIGDGLTDTEAANFYTAVQAYQTTLGRSIGTQTVSDPDAQAFVTAANIEDQVQAQAVNQLVIDMKAANIWTKMKAIYPFVGGTAASHKWNLKNPLDTNAAFRLQFNGGYTHSSTGIAGNGTNAYADTFLVPDTVFSVADNVHLSIYSRTNAAGLGDIDMGGYNGSQVGGVGALYLAAGWNNLSRAGLHQGTEISFSNLNSLGFYIGTRIGSAQKIFRNTTIGVSVTSATALKLQNKIALSAAFSSPAYGSGVDTGLLSAKEYAFASIGDGLTDTEAANFYTVVQNFNTALNRQVV